MSLAVIPESQRKLREWVDAGLIGPDQAEAIRRYEASAPFGGGRADVESESPSAGRRRVPLLGEALGYLGGSLVVIAGGLLLVRQWDRLRFGAKLGLVAVLAVVLFAAGAYLRDVREPAAQRLAGFAWALTVGAVAWFAGLVGGTDGLDLQPAPLGLLISGTATALAAVLWAVKVRWQQQVITYIAASAVVVSLLSLPRADPDQFFYGLALSGFAVVWLLVGATGLLPPPTTARWVGLIGLLVGLRVTPSEYYTGTGLVIAVVAAAALLALGVVAEQPLLLGFGAAAVFLSVPQAVFHFFGDTLGAPVALLVIGLVLIGTALVVVRARPDADGEALP